MLCDCKLVFWEEWYGITQKGQSKLAIAAPLDFTLKIGKIMNCKLVCFLLTTKILLTQGKFCS